MNNQTYTEYACPVVGCEYTDQNVDSLISHVAGKAMSDDDHREQRDSDDHRRFWYEQETRIESEQMRF